MKEILAQLAPIAILVGLVWGWAFVSQSQELPNCPDVFVFSFDMIPRWRDPELQKFRAVFQNLNDKIYNLVQQGKLTRELGRQFKDVGDQLEQEIYNFFIDLPPDGIRGKQYCSYEELELEIRAMTASQIQQIREEYQRLVGPQAPESPPTPQE